MADGADRGSRMVKLAELWERESAKGSRYFSGYRKERQAVRASNVSPEQAGQHRPAATRPLVTRERLAELTASLERRIAEGAIAPAALDVLARARALLRGPGR